MKSVLRSILAMLRGAVRSRAARHREIVAADFFVVPTATCRLLFVLVILAKTGVFLLVLKTKLQVNMRALRLRTPEKREMPRAAAKQVQ